MPDSLLACPQLQTVFKKIPRLFGENLLFAAWADINW